MQGLTDECPEQCAPTGDKGSSVVAVITSQMDDG